MYTFINGFETSTSTGEKRKVVMISVSSEDDLPKAETSWGCGSIAHVVKTADFYALNDFGEWINQTSQDESETSSTDSFKSPLIDVMGNTGLDKAFTDTDGIGVMTHELSGDSESM